jgi:uncharacterized protein (TIGR02001 family)
VTRRRWAAIPIRAGAIGAALLAGTASLSAADLDQAPVEAAASSHKISFSANVDLTTDYIFRGISQTDEGPAIQGGFELAYNILYLGVWGSNVDFGTSSTSLGNSRNLANIEIDWYGGIKPVLKGVSFDIGLYDYTYPNSLGIADLDYMEVKTGASHTFFEKLTLGVTNWWTPNNSGDTGANDVLEFSGAYALKKLWIFSPTVSALIGRQWGDESQGGYDYTYWNAGVTFGFHEKPVYSFDVRYWDTNLPGCSNATIFQCDQRVIGTFQALF